VASAGLRVVQFWQRTAVQDQIFTGMGSVTVGPTGTDFTVPANGIPASLPLFKKGWNGWHVGLGPGVEGEVASSGAIKPVNDVLADEEAAGTRSKAPSRKAKDFRLVKLAPGDWGFLRIGQHGFYFRLDEPERRKVGGQGTKDKRALLLAFGWAAALCIIGLSLTLLFDPEDFDQGEALMAYVVRITQPPLFSPKPPEPEKKEKPKAGVATGEKKAKPASTIGKEGKAGGKGDKPRMTAATRKTDPNPKEDLIKNVEDKGLLKHKGALSSIAGPDIGDRRLESAMAKVGPTAGYGRGTGTGLGDGVNGTGTSLRGGTGSGGGGRSPHDFVSAKPIDTGTGRPAKGKPGGTGLGETEVGFKSGTPDTDLGGLTPEQVRKVVESHRALIAYCFNKELQKNPRLNGKVVMSWRITPQGVVESVRVKSSSIGSADVEDCLSRQVAKWKFPAAANGQETDVRYPFAFKGAGG
jgi:TonB family protein